MLPVCCNRGIDKIGGFLFEMVSQMKPFVAVVAVDISIFLVPFATSGVLGLGHRHVEPLSNTSDSSAD
jgi:hypothetical protein